MKAIITNSLQVIAAIVITVGAIASAAPMPEETHQGLAHSIVVPETVEDSSKDEAQPETVENGSPEPIEVTQPIIPEEPKPTPAPQPVQDDRAPLGVSDRGGNGSCAAEILKYDWHQGIALAVASAESELRPGIVNNNPSTGDYSVGCFQVNLYGANARNRPSEAELRNAEVNVRWAYNNYISNGRSFIGQWGVCNSKVACH